MDRGSCTEIPLISHWMRYEFVDIAIILYIHCKCNFLSIIVRIAIGHAIIIMYTSESSVLKWNPHLYIASSDSKLQLYYYESLNRYSQYTECVHVQLSCTTKA